MLKNHVQLSLLISAIAFSTACMADIEGSEPNGEKADDNLRIGTFPGPNGALRAAYRVEGDNAVVGGDILIPLTSMQSNSRVAAEGPGKRWPGGVIPYVLEDQFPKKAAFEAAAAKWNAHTATTGITIKPRTNEANYVFVTNRADTCNSNLGMLGGVQYINVGADFCGTDPMVHELGHTIGLIHEHQRPDRDKFVKIDFDNIVGGREDAQNKVDFGVVTGALVQSTYDYYSVMHYGSYLSGAVDESKPVIVVLTDGIDESLVGNTTLSNRDLVGVGKMYKGAAGGGGDDGGTDGGTGQTDCVNPCDTYGVAEGECQVFTTGAFQCSNGCLYSVASCEQAGGGFTCNDGTIIQAAYECDQIVDCPDSSDETNCAGGAGGGTGGGGTTGGDTFTCNNGNEIIQAAYLCDQIVDCSDGSDENNCGGTTTGGSGGGNVFVCNNGGTVPASYQCDGYLDCTDSSDEANCGGTTGDTFNCNNGVTIPAAYQCDGDNDCGDLSDEANCGGGSVFTCNNGSTVPASYQCDGYLDCTDSSDEANCGAASNGFVCNNGFTIPAAYQCDGDNDCGDFSDETGC
jgi:hypothetical protein